MTEQLYREKNRNGLRLWRSFADGAVIKKSANK
jgi:hypothetical protein